ncbi:MAG: transglutaminase-like domain-containing protein, partial [Ignavibacteriaceae bacterium]|nr:transglutaminase-like domain-containing protein [Ignavibacteriaceae bacterium]
KIIPLLSLFLAYSAFASEKDISLNKTIKYTIESSGKTYTLSSEVSITQKLYSKKSIQRDYITIPEPYYAPVENIKCKVNKDKIHSDKIYFENVERKDIFIGNNKMHIIKLPDNLREGDEIKYSYEQEFTDIAFLPIETIPNINSVDQLIIEIEHPGEISINFDFFFPHNKLNYSIQQESDKTVLRFDSLTEFKNVPYGEFNDILGAFIINVKLGDIDITPNTPSSFMKWYSCLRTNNSDKKTDFKSLFRDKIKDNLTPVEKLTIINDYVRENIRYIANEKGIRSIVPDDPSAVFERKYGDCKDKAFLVSAIAKEYGLEVYPALTSSEEFPSFSGFHINLFDHLICSYKSNKQYLFFDPTAEFMAFATLHQELAGKPAFIIDSLNPHYELISNENASSAIDINICGNMDSLGYAKAKITFHKDLYSFALDLLNNYKQKDFRDIIPNLVASFLRNIGLEITDMPDKVNHNPELDDNSFTFYANADLSEFIIPSIKKSYIPKTPFIFITDRILQREKDSSSLLLSQMPRISLNIELKSVNYSVSRDSLSIPLKLSSGYYSSADNKNGNILKFNYVFDPPFNYIKPNDKSDFIKFCKSYFSNKKQMFVLTRTTP